MMRKAVLVLMMALLIGLTDWPALAQSQATKPSETTAVPKKPLVPEISALTPVRIERASVLSEGELALDARLAIDLNREFRGRDYDNVRLAPLGVRYAANDKDDRLAPEILRRYTRSVTCLWKRLWDFFGGLFRSSFSTIFHL
jgi:hypothetical protein